MNAQKTGLLIYEMRTRKGLTQKELAEKCNVTDKAVSKWERGEGCPDVTVLPKLAEIFGIEVESLMNGEIPLSQDVSGKTIKIYDFKRPDRYSREMQHVIWMLADDICQKINKEYSIILNDRFESELFCVDQLINKEFLSSIPQKCFFYDFNYTDQTDGGFTVEIDPQLAKALLKQDYSKHASITDFDLDVFKNYFLKIIVDVFYKNVEQLTGGKINLANQNPFEKGTAAGTGNNSRQEERRMLLMLGIKAKLGDTEGYINCQFSDVLIDKLLMNGYFSGENDKIKIQNLSNIKNHEKPDNIFVELGRFHPENVELEPGKILILDKKETDGLDVVFENRIIHTGKTVCIDELFGIEIAETTQLSETEYTEKDYISIQLGSASLKKEEIAALHQGSYITLKQRAGNPAQIIRSGKVVATGEICIADDTFAIRVIEVK